MLSDGIPRIKAVAALDTKRLRVLFENGVVKVYHCGRLLRRPQFFLLKTPAFFRAVHVDAGGYGVVWNDDLDISEYELWTKGRQVQA